MVSALVFEVVDGAEFVGSFCRWYDSQKINRCIQVLRREYQGMLSQLATAITREKRVIIAIVVPAVTLALTFGTVAYTVANISVLGALPHGIFGLVIGLMIGDLLVNDYINDQSGSKTYFRKEVSGSNLSERTNEYPACGDYILTRFEAVRSPEFSDGVEIVIDMPGYSKEIMYEYPYIWDTEQGISEVADARGLDKSELHKLEGMPVLVKTLEGTQSSFSSYHIHPPEMIIQKMWDNKEIEVDDVDVEVISENFDVSLPDSMTGESTATTNNDGGDIEVDDSGLYNVVDSVR